MPCYFSYGTVILYKSRSELITKGITPLDNFMAAGNDLSFNITNQDKIVRRVITTITPHKFLSYRHIHLF
ncbi:hypothetical protein BH23THE1_BH23THE1_24610 [soil metagenome]